MTKPGLNDDSRTAPSDNGIPLIHDDFLDAGIAQEMRIFSSDGIQNTTERRRVHAHLARSHHDLQQMIAALDALRDGELKRLAQEMHDDLGQLLAAMKMDLSTLRRHLPQDDDQSLQQLNNINKLVDTMVISVRRIIADLPPKALDDLGLFCALDMLVSSFEQRHGIKSRLIPPNPEPIIDEAIATPVYRMVQEALNNVAKHAKATQVDVGIDCCDSRLMLSITDNGAGLSCGMLQKPGSYGLIGMRERAAALGGELKIESNNGVGTAIRIMIPMNAGGA